LPASTPPLRIAILGAGKIGSVFAFQLARAGGHDVTVIARPGSLRLRQLERDGAIVDIKGERAVVQVAGVLDELIPYDLVIVTMLAHQADAMMPALQRSAAKCVQFMFNTFEPEKLQESLGIERCAFGMPFVQATLDADGRLKATIGAGGQKTIMNRQRSVDLFNAAGLPAALEPNMPLWLRCHVPLCVAFESVSVAAWRRGRGASWGEALILARGVHASFALIKGLGYEVYPKMKKRIAGSPSPLVALALWSLSRIKSFRELLATGETECCALVDTMVAAGAAAKPALMTSKIEVMKPS
jgi:2-dehydropantoate 2-reductase